MIFNLNTGLPLKKMKPVFTYTGSYELKTEKQADGTMNWELALLSGGTLTFSRVVPEIDAFLVGPGATGGTGTGNLQETYGGAGGSGGTIKTVTGISVSTGVGYQITIGKTGPTKAFNYSAAKGGGKSGGSGAWQYGKNNGDVSDGEAGKNGVYAFGASSSLYKSGRRYGPGGGGGSSRNGWHIFTSPAGAGGTTGGGDGAASGKGKDGAANTGAGGGGGQAWAATDTTIAMYAGGAGGSGIVIIRNAR